MHPSSRARSGFTILELSIVISIIGLIIGGVLGGRALIRGAELNSVVSEFRKYTTATTQFRDKYSSLPGDMSNATSYWSSTNVGNGDGNGRITNTASASSNEISQYWIHLANGGFVEGSFTSVAGVTLTPSTNNPASRMKGGAWNVAYLGTMADAGTGTPTTGGNVTGVTGPDTSTFFSNTYEHVLLFSKGTSAVGCGPTGSTCGILEPADAYNIDSKLDDGKPQSGDVTTLESQGATSGTTRCTDQASSTSALATTSSYVLQTTSPACSLVFKIGY